MTGSAASRVRQALDTDARMSRAIHCNTLLMRNLSLLGLDAMKEWKELQDPHLKGAFLPGDAGPFVASYIKENFLRAVNKNHQFTFMSQFRPVIPAYNSYIKSVYNGAKCLFRGKTGKGSFIVEMERSATFVTDQVIHIVLEAPPTGTQVVNNSQTGGQNETAIIRSRYCDFPGARVLDDVSVKFQQAKFDLYTSADAMNRFDLLETPETRRALEDCYGQTELRVAKMDNTVFDVDQCMLVGDGYQNYKASQDDLEVWHPLQFAYNNDINLALPVSNIDNQIMQIDVTLTKLENVVSSQLGRAIVSPPALPFSPAIDYTNYTSLKIKRIELYSNNVYLDDCVRDKFLNNEFKLIFPIHQQFRKRLVGETDTIQLDKIKYLISELIICFSRETNESTMDNWYKCGYQNARTFCGILLSTCNTNSPTAVGRTYHYDVYQSLLANFSLKTRDEPFIEKMKPDYFTRYLPYRRSQYRSRLSKAPESDKMLFTFSEVVNDPYHNYSTSNQSRDQEFTLEYEAANDANGNPMISRTNPANLVITGFAQTIFITKCGTAANYVQ